MMFDSIRKMFSNGILSAYERTGKPRRFSLYGISPGRSRKTLRPVLIKEYSEEGMEVEKKLDSLYRARPLAEILPELRNPHIASTLEAETTDTRRVEIIDPVPGPTLREIMGRGEMTPRDFIDCILQAARGLSHLHSLDLVHRGLTPDVITVGEAGAKITDLSFLMDAGKAHHGSTMTGASRYSAPEILKRAPIDARSDIFSLGAILYEGVCGAPIFPHASGFERLLRVMNSKPDEPSEKNCFVNDQLNAVIMKAVAKNPAERYAAVDEFISALEAAPLPEKLGHHAPAYAA